MNEFTQGAQTPGLAWARTRPEKHPHMPRSSEQLQEDVTVPCRAVSPRAGSESTIGVPGVLQGRSPLGEQELPLPCPGGSGPPGCS